MNNQCFSKQTFSGNRSNSNRLFFRIGTEFKRHNMWKYFLYDIFFAPSPLVVELEGSWSIDKAWRAVCPDHGVLPMAAGCRTSAGGWWLVMGGSK